MTTAKSAQRVSTLSRIFAWILFVVSTLTFLDFVVNYYLSGSLTLSVSGAALIGASFLFCYPIFAYVAITGNAPHWMSAIEQSFDQEFGQRDKHATRIFRSFAFRVLFFSSLMTLIAVADHFRLFGDDIRGAAILVFSLLSVATAALIFQRFKFSSRHLDGP